MKITTTVDAANHIICGTTSSFSPFALFQPDQSPAITSTNAATFTAGTVGTFTATASGVPTPALIESGTLPTGVVFSDNGDGTASLMGTPGTSGTFTITITANNAAGSATQSFALSVDQGPAITSANSATFTECSPGSFTVTATGFPAATLSESGALPSGVAFNSATSLLSGTPGGSGTFTITITASNAAGSVVQTFTLTVDQGPAITSANSATFTANSPGSFTVAASGFPVPGLSETGALPTGVSFTDSHNGTGTLSGTPSSAGTFSVSFGATNGVGSGAVQTFTFTVNNPAPTIGSLLQTSATAGSAAFTLTVNGTNFVNGATVNFSANARTTTFVNSAQLTAAITAADLAIAGTFPVTVTNPARAAALPLLLILRWRTSK